MTEQEFERLKEGSNIKGEILDLEYNLDILKTSKTANLASREAKSCLVEYLEPSAILHAIDESITIITRKINKLKEEFAAL